MATGLQVLIIIFLVIILSVKCILIQVALESLDATQSAFNGVEGTKGNVSCRCKPNNATYNFIRWRYSDTGNFSTAERVYQYDAESNYSDGRLLGRATHSHDPSTGILTLITWNQSLQDSGTYFCEFRGSINLDANMTADIFSNPLERNIFDVQIQPKAVYRKAFRATAWYEGNKPPVMLHWHRTEDNKVVDSQNQTKTQPVPNTSLSTSSSEYYIPSVCKEFKLYIKMSHPTIASGKQIQLREPVEVQLVECPFTPAGKTAGISLGALSLTAGIVLWSFFGYKMISEDRLQIPVIVMGLCLATAGLVLVTFFSIQIACNAE